METRFGLLGALESSLTERDARDPIAGTAGVDQRLPNGLDATLAQRDVVTVRPPRVRMPVDPYEDVRVRLHVAGHLLDLLRLVRVDHRLVEVEQDVGDRWPLRIGTRRSRHTGGTLSPRGTLCAHGSLRT